MRKSQIYLLRQELKDTKRVVECAKELGVVGDTTRLKICYLLCRHPELSVSEIADLLGISISTVSHSLRRLKEIELVKTRRDAQKIYYSFKNSPLSRLLRNYLRFV